MKSEAELELVVRVAKYDVGNMWESDGKSERDWYLYIDLYREEGSPQ